MIKFPKQININDYYTVKKEAKYDFNVAIEVLASELKKAGVDNPENIAYDIAYSDNRSCKWGKKFEQWTERSYAFDEKGYKKAVAIHNQERNKAINSLMTLETTENQSYTAFSSNSISFHNTRGMECSSLIPK